MAYTRPCNKCGQRISLREMPHGQWVAFDVSTEETHVCGVQHEPDVAVKLKGKNKFRDKEDESIDQMYNEGATEHISSIYFMSFGQVWNKKGFIIGLSYIAPLDTNETDGLENNDELKDVIMQGDVSFNIGFSI